MPTDPHTLHRNSLVADMHCDTVLRLRGGLDFSRRNISGHVDLPRLEAGSVNLQVFAAFVHPTTPTEQCVATADSLLDLLEARFSRHSGRIAMCASADDAERTVEKQRIAAVLAIENGQAIAHDLKNLEHFYRRGIRIMTLCHAVSHDWCTSSSDRPQTSDGLRVFGRDVVRSMNDLGMLVDVSHLSAAAVRDVLRVTRDPVIASHSCAYSLCAHERNLTDDQIRAIADSGGLVGINFCDDFLSDACWRATQAYVSRHPETKQKVDELMNGHHNETEYERRLAELQPLLEARQAGAAQVHASVATVVDHIDHVVTLVGPDHVGLGSDFDGILWPPTGLSDCSQMGNITVELVRRGYADTNIKKVLGGNFMRVFRQVCHP